MCWAPLIETPAVDKVTMGSRVCEAEQRGSIQNVLCKDRVEKLCSQLNRKIRETEGGEGERGRSGAKQTQPVLNSCVRNSQPGLEGQILQIARGGFLTFQQHTDLMIRSFPFMKFSFKWPNLRLIS